MIHSLSFIFLEFLESGSLLFLSFLLHFLHPGMVEVAAGWWRIEVWWLVGTVKYLGCGREFWAWVLGGGGPRGNNQWLFG